MNRPTDKTHVIARPESAIVSIIACSKQSNPPSITGKIASKRSIIDRFKNLTPRNDVKRENFLSPSLRPAFTLAEVLITLGIIGVVAAMTIPTLMQGIEDQSTVTALKKAHSTLSQAYTMAVQENGTPDTWGLTNDGAGGEAMLKNFAPYLRISKNCGTGPGCFPTTAYKLLNGNDYPTADFDGNTTFAKAWLQDGTSLIIETVSSDCTLKKGDTLALQSVCAEIYVDINALKKPNQYGKDWFAFYMTKFGIIPKGSQQQTIGAYNFDNSCRDKTSEGYSCTAWVIYNENRDYLKCPGTLSWNGKTKCD